MPPLLEGFAHPLCRASVIVPARNEQASLSATLDALAAQRDEADRPIDPHTFEVLLLLNNCTDDSLAVAKGWKGLHPNFSLHIFERTLPRGQAHVGTARRLLMDTAWHRLQRSDSSVRAILSTDSDTLVDPHWIANTLAALVRGADAVGGVIYLKPGEHSSLPRGARIGYQRDRRYQRLVAELEDLLDPQLGDPWPRHLEHFGASLACTTQAYKNAGGMPPVTPLEDIAFVNALRCTNARIRHEPSVAVYTSARLDGRADIGLSHQLRIWQRMADENTVHYVPSAAALCHRFKTFRTLREFCHNADVQLLSKYPKGWIKRLVKSRGTNPVAVELFIDIDCELLLNQTFAGVHDDLITRVNRNLAQVITSAKTSKSSPLEPL